MEGVLTVGTKIKTMYGNVLTVEKFLAEGGQGSVYVVNYKGEKKALKWYKRTAMKDPQAFYEHIKYNIIKKSPSEEFLWPIDITEQYNDTFGYIMDLRPEGYYEVKEFTLCHVQFKSYKAVVTACLKIVSAFRILHNYGYSYQDINDRNFFINPDNGDVLICDNDNVVHDGKNVGIAGTPRYMAPEVVMKKNMPNALSDRFSMSVIIYILFCLNHPLEGKKYLVPALTLEDQQKLYGSDPVFMMDPYDRSNAPDSVVHSNSIQIWSCLPDYIQEIFLKSFSKKSFEKPSARPAEKEWLNVLARFRSDIISCSCGNEVFTKNGASCICDLCGKRINIPFKLTFSQYSIPAVKGSRIYRCQLGVCNQDAALEPIASVVENKLTGALGIKNKSGKCWDIVISKGAAGRAAPDEVIPLKNGMTFTIYDSTVKIQSDQ